MTNINMDIFYDNLVDLINTLYDKEFTNIQQAAKLCADSIAEGGVVHVFGSGHSIGFGMEMANRAGSLVPIHTIDTADFVLKGSITYENFKDPNNIFERRPNVSDKLYDLYDVKPADAFIIISNSGINGVVIDMAITARAKGHKVIVVTSWQHTNAEDSRHPSGKKLHELGHVVIDNCGPRGDALIETDGVEKICSVSSITGAFIAQTIGTEVCEILVNKNIELPVLYSEDMPNYQEHNKELLEKYKGRI